jgi:hypothetical protein
VSDLTNSRREILIAPPELKVRVRANCSLSAGSVTEAGPCGDSRPSLLKYDVLGERDANHMIEAARLPATLRVFGAALAIPN